MGDSLRRWVRALVVAAGIVSLGAALVVWQLRRRDQHLAPDGIVDAGEAHRSGSPADRGKGGKFAIDVERLQQEEGLEPAVEYLTFIMSRRGTTEHLLFVRNEDLDAIAALEGQEPEIFLKRLQHLGVVISNN